MNVEDDKKIKLPIRNAIIVDVSRYKLLYTLRHNYQNIILTRSYLR